MGSSIIMIDCPNCGGMGYIDDEYKDGVRTTGCDDCEYKLIENYNPDTREIYDSTESGRDKGIGSGRIIEIVELGRPQSIIQRDDNLITELIKTNDLVDELNKQLKHD